MSRLATLSTLLAALCMVSARADQPVPQPIKLDVISWLLGDWAFENGQTITGESWQRAGESTWEGFGYVIRDGDTSRTEDLRLLSMQGEIYYLSKVGHNQLPVAFKLMSWSDSACVFENAAHDFPQRISYTRTEGGVTARIEGVSEGEAQSVNYPFLKAARPPKIRQVME